MRTGIRGKGFCFILIIFLCLAVQVPNCRAQEVSGAFRSDIVKLLKMTGAEALGLQMGIAVSNQIIESISNQNPNIPPKAVAAIKDEVSQVFTENMPKMTTKIVQVYAKHFTHEEIKGLIAFYETPLGKKSIHEMPAVMNECMLLGREWGKSLLPELHSRLKARLEREGFGPKSEQKGKSDAAQKTK